MSRVGEQVPTEGYYQVNVPDKEYTMLLGHSFLWFEEFAFLQVAWHFRNVEKEVKTSLMAKAKEVYNRHGFEVLTVSKRFENVPSGRDRGDACIYILRSLFGLDWEERVNVRPHRLSMEVSKLNTLWHF